MQEEEKPQKVVKINTVVASGIAAAMAALFTSGLGVAGTIIGAALTAMTINLGSAVLSAQIEKASTRISSLPDTVRERLSTQQARTPGKRAPEPEPEPATTPAARESFFGRLRSSPQRLRSMPSSGRRRVLLAGALAGLVATFIGLAAVTGVEATAGETLSCLVWGECQEEETASGSTNGARTSIGRVFGGSSGAGSAPSEEQQQIPPGDEQQAPPQPAGEPAQPGAGGGAARPDGTPQSPGAAPDQDPPAQPGAPRGAQPGADGKVEPTPPAPPTGEAPAKGQGRIPEREPEDRGPESGQQKEDRGNPGPL